MQKKGSYKDYVKNVAAPCLIYGALTGVIVGTVVFFFRLTAEWLIEKSVELYTLVSANPVYIPLVILIMAGLAFLMSLVLRYTPEVEGCGISRAEGILRGIITFRWLRTGIALILNSFISIFAGLPLDSEGPSVFLGTLIGGGTCRLPLSHNSWNRYIMTGGASAGFAVATNAPVTGILFALEEAHKRFTPMILLMAMSSVFFGTATSDLWSSALGHEPGALFHIGEMLPLSINNIWIPVLIGLFAGLLACAFNQVIFLFGHLFETKLKKIPQWARLLAVFVLVGTIGILSVGEFKGTDALYGGVELIVKISEMDFAVKILLAIIAIRFLTTALATSSGATGGVTMPMLSIGALLGGLLGKLFIEMGMDSSLYSTVVMIGMASLMGACARTPITAVVFLLESTRQFNNLFYVGIAVFIAFLICEVLKIEPLYDVLLEDMLEKQNEHKHAEIMRTYYIVQPGSFAVEKSSRDILWPANTIVRNVVTLDNVKTMDNDGERKFHVGDKVSLQVQTYDEASTRKELNDLLGVQTEQQDSSETHCKLQ